MTDNDPAIQDRLERVKQRSVMICTPIARNPVWQYTASLISTAILLQEYGIRFSFQFVVGSSVISRARNELCAYFLKSDFTDLLFIDDDMQWSPADVVRLLASDKPLIGGVGRMKIEKPNSDPAVWCWRPIKGEGNKVNQDDFGAIEVLGIGAAFMLINKCVFIDMIEAHPEWKRSGAHDWPDDLRAHYFEFFAQTADEAGHEISEDYTFCNRYREVGGKVWADPAIKLGHVGTFNFQGSVGEILVPAQ